MGANLKARLRGIRDRAGRSPIKANPLRLPGQSLDEEIARLIDEKANGYLFIGFLMIALVAFEWLRTLIPTAITPLLMTVLGLPIVGYCAYRLVRLRSTITNLRLGRDGERAVGQFLDDKLRPLGYQVLHDIVAGRWNIDHLIIGNSGIYTVETKTRTKPRRGQASVKFDGESITIAGWKPDRDPIVQAKYQAAWLSETISRSLGLKLHVKPVIVFPGWYVDPPPEGAHETVWVLSAKQLPPRIITRTHVLDPKTANTVGHFLRQLVRSG